MKQRRDAGQAETIFQGDENCLAAIAPLLVTLPRRHISVFGWWRIALAMAMDDRSRKGLTAQSRGKSSRFERISPANEAPADIPETGKSHYQTDTAGRSGIRIRIGHGQKNLNRDQLHDLFVVYLIEKVGQQAQASF
jgi:hypothetical protein